MARKKKMTEAEMKLAMQRAAKRVRDRNYRFRLMTPAAKRVRIAKDVIDQLEGGKLIAKQGTYLEILDDEASMVFETVESMDSWSEPSEEEREAQSMPLHRVLDDNQCQVCGIGAAFVAAVKRADACTVGDMESMSDSKYMREYLSSWFEREQLGLIEAAFEGEWSFATDQGAILREAERAASFNWRESDPSTRLQNIMQNIVDNDGRFVP